MSCRGGRRKPAEYDGKVAWEAYSVQFEMLADAQGWDDAERILQLVSSLRGPAVEIMAHLTLSQRASYRCIVEALQRSFGHQHQTEVCRARLKRRMRQRDEPLPQLAQDVDSLVRGVYPAAPESMVDVLARDHFVDAMQDQQLQIYVKQAHPGNLQVALARALEFEAFTQVTGSEHVAVPRHDVRTRKGQVQTSTEPGKSSSGEFEGVCWECGEKGYKRNQCPRGRRTRSLDRLGSYSFEPACWGCGQTGHFSNTCPQPKKVAPVGNASGLDGGAKHQPTTPGPQVQ